MNFTREPIIETVITPREGCKLVVRSSKGNGQEDYFVDAVEVVSFGHSFFFRSSERPKPFLVPVGDYEILELKETRMVLKNVTTDRSIKIGGGREPHHPRPHRESAAPEPREEASVDGSEQTSERSSEPRHADQRAPERSQDRSQDRKRDKRRRGRRGGRDRHEPHSQEMRDRPSEEHLPSVESSENASQEVTRPEVPRDEPPKAPSYISKLFPPPSTLIKETLSRYKPAEPVEEQISIKEEKISIEEESLFDHPISGDSSKEADEENRSEE